MHDMHEAGTTNPAGTHLIADGVLGVTFRSDKYPWCPAGYFAMKFTDPEAHEAIMLYAHTVAQNSPLLARDLVLAMTAAQMTICGSEVIRDLTGHN